jgi:hypothetical protein
MKMDILATRNSVTRRKLLQVTVAGSMPFVFGGLSNLSIVSAGQSSCSSRLREWDQSRLSNAVLDHVADDLSRVRGSILSRGSKTASDVRTVASNASLLFNHFQEVGLNPVLEQYMRECPQAVLNFVPQQEQLRSMQDFLAAHSVSVSLDQLRGGFSLPLERKSRGLSEIQRVGIQGFANRLAESLNQLANSLEQQTSGMMKVRYVRTLRQDEGADIICDGLSFLAALSALGCAFGLVPFCFSSALLWLLEATLELFGFC